MRVLIVVGLSLVGFAFGSPGRAAERPVLAVFDVELRGVKLSKVARDNLSDYLGGLLSAKGFQVVPRDQLKERLMAQKRTSYKSCYDQSCQVELGRELAADKSLASQIFALGGKCRVVLTLYDLKRSASAGAGVGVGGCKEPEIVNALERAVDQLISAQAAPAEASPPVPAAVAAPPKSPRWIKSAPAKVWFSESEVTVGQYVACMDAGKCTRPRAAAEGKYCNWGNPERADHPINCVDWNQAIAFCTFVGGRLPTNDEWVAEATAGGKRPYPWGAQEVGCDRAVWGKDGNGCKQDATWPVCSKPLGKSVSGLCDMGGNVWEWTASIETGRPDRRMLRGGSWSTSDPLLFRAAGYAWGGTASVEDAFGFRCVRDQP